ncbi:MAG: 4-hydroxyphenylacetate 3-hydroxylase N-terminal domain-containing protein [Phycisphaerales bacterium]
MSVLETAPPRVSGSPAPPPTGAEHLERLRDERRVFIEGELVEDVTEHPSMRNAVRSIAGLYDALHDPELRDVLCVEADAGPPRLTHRAFRASRSREDLLATRDAIAAWSRLSYGWMGRTPDYKASLTTTLGPNASFYGPFADNARRWYERAQQELPFLGHAVANPPIDKHLKPHEIADVPVRIVRENDAGIFVSGAKVVATSAAMATHCFVGQTPNTASEDPAQAVMFIVPIGAPGVRLICRSSYEHSAARHGSPFDYPLSSRFDENDAILTFEDVFVPWEDVLIHRDPQRVRAFFPSSGFVNGFLFHGCTRFAVKLDFFAGLFAKVLECVGGMGHRSRRAMLGEVIAMRHTFWSLSNAMASCPDAWSDGAVLPNKEAALAHCVMGPDAYVRLVDIIQKTVASGLIYLPSCAADLEHPEIAPLLEKYVRGSEGIGHVERIKLMKLMWDAIGSEFAGRHALYERSYAGGWECTRLMVANEAIGSGRAGAMTGLVDRCLSDYDASGWAADPWRDASTGGA